MTGVPVDKEPVIAKAVADLLPGWDWRRSDDALAFEMEAPHVKQLTELAVNQALQTIRNRVDEFGVAEPTIARQGLDSDRVVIQLPGVDDPERVKRLIRNTAFLEFRLVDYPPNGANGVSREELVEHYGGTIPAAVEIMSEETRDRQGRLTGQSFYAVEKKRVITGRDLRSASPGSGQFNQPIVHFSLTPDGAKIFGEATGANINRGLAIILDGKVMSAPRINARITDSGIIEGRFTQQEVQDLVTVLRSGALPAGITYLEDRTVGPSLGADSVRSGVRAGLTGAILVVLMMIVVYMGSSVNSILMLTVNVALIFGGLAYFGATLTLPGIAGIILTAGMAVDASVLVFERIREELDAGKTVKAAVDAGFANAMSSILDGNITTLIAALFLFQFGTGPVRGFAVTLSIGILGTLFAMVFGARWLFDLMLARNPRAEKISI
jgi:preprotein translocase subunit SecD